MNGLSLPADGKPRRKYRPCEDFCLKMPRRVSLGRRHVGGGDQKIEGLGSHPFSSENVLRPSGFNIDNPPAIPPKSLPLDLSF
ncbi:MAG TPA: hypothetical protein VFX30_12265, partial [bacterium]|nr:hypothetical protein [bacterium]